MEQELKKLIICINVNLNFTSEKVIMLIDYINNYIIKNKNIQIICLIINDTIQTIEDNLIKFKNINLIKCQNPDEIISHINNYQLKNITNIVLFDIEFIELFDSTNKYCHKLIIFMDKYNDIIQKLNNNFNLLYCLNDKEKEKFIFNDVEETKILIRNNVKHKYNKYTNDTINLVLPLVADNDIIKFKINCNNLILNLKKIIYLKKFIQKIKLTIIQSKLNSSSLKLIFKSVCDEIIKLVNNDNDISIKYNVEKNELDEELYNYDILVDNVDEQFINISQICKINEPYNLLDVNKIAELEIINSKCEYLTKSMNDAQTKIIDKNNKFVEYLKNKSVIIVGPAEHVNCGNYIDTFDIVIRLNHGYNLTLTQPEKYGTKTNIVYHCVNQLETNGGVINYLDKIDYLVLAYPLLDEQDTSSFINSNIDDYNLIDILNDKIISIDKEKYIEFETKLETRPNTGTISIWDILKYETKSVEVIGFTLFQTDYNSKYRAISSKYVLNQMEAFKTHSQKNIASYYKELIDGNKLKYEPILKENIDKLLNNGLQIVNNKLKIINNDTLIINNEFELNKNIKDYIITLLGYTKIKPDGSRHTNWFPWNRFLDVFKTIGYKAEWVELDDLVRNEEKRLFITWNEPTSLELYQSGKILSDDIIFQKLTSLGKGMENENWTSNPKEWCKTWNWPIYKTLEYLYDLGLNIYGFGCKTEYDEFPEKKRICEKLADRIHWISWGGTPFNWEQIKNAKPHMENLTDDINFVGSKWGVVGRGNIDAWEKYITPLENNSQYKFNQYGGIGNKMVSDEEMVEILKKSKICPIVHAPSWQAERGIQDRFYTVFLAGRFGICDNLGAIDIFGDEIKEICTENPEEYNLKSVYYLEHPEEQLKYIEIVQNKIKTEFNFYRQWENTFKKVDNKRNNKNIDLITNFKYKHINISSINNNYVYKGENINNYFDKIFVVNLKKDNDKKLQILKIFDYFNIINFEFIEAINGNDEKYDDFFQNKNLNTMWEKINNQKHIKKRGELGCLLSHLQILKIAKDRNYNKWLHLEDDIILHKNFSNLFEDIMNNTPNDWDILYFGSTQCYWRNNYTKEYVNKYIYKANLSCGTFSFAVSNKNLNYIIEKYETMTMPADSIIVTEIQPFLNCYVSFPNLMIANLYCSGIRKNIGIEKLYANFNWNNNEYMYDIPYYKILKDENIRNQYNLICNNMINIEEYSNYLKDKKIVIIGPAPSCKDIEEGEFIEKNYDIIVRINKQWKHSKELEKYIGKRTDILYNCMDYRDDCGGELDIDYLENKIKYLVASIKYDFLNKEHRDSQFHGKSFLNWYNYFHLKNNNKLKFIPIDNNFYDKYDSLAQTRINTGLISIFHLLTFDIKELYIKGFTFFMDGYLLDYRNIINGIECKNEEETKNNVFDFMINQNKNHDQNKQFKLFKDVYKKNKNIIKLDKRLQEIINLKNIFI